MISPPGPTPKRPRSGGRLRPRAGWSRPPSARTPFGPTPVRCAASPPGSTAASSTMRCWPPISPSCTTPAAPRRAPRWRSPRRASARSSPVSRPRPGERTARVLAGYRRTASDLGRGQARPFVASDLAAVLATCHRPRRRGRGVESEEVALRARAARRGDRGTAVYGGNATQRGECAALGRRRQFEPTATGSSSPCAVARRIQRAR